MTVVSATVREAYPLSWPEGWVRTRPQDQKPMGSWKKTANQYREALKKELERMGAPAFVISSNVQLTARGSMTPGVEPLDKGVAVYFSRPSKEDFAWQDALGIETPYPTEEEIAVAFRRLAAQYHPDRGGEITMFQAVTRHRDNALAWIRQQAGREFGLVLACDQFREVRLNMAAIVFTIKSIRQIERCGASSLLERVFKGFSALPQQATAASDMRDAAGVR